MKTLSKILTVAVAGAALGGTLPAWATITTTDFSTSDGGMTYTAGSLSGSQLIPDNNPSGVGYALNFGTTGLNLSDVSVSITTSGGYNGDIYAYLSNGSTLIQLLNPNTAVSGSGYNITLAESGSAIPTGGSGVLTGPYVSYGHLSMFNGSDPNGTWTLFFADLSAGDTSTLDSFSVNFATSAVPEPVNAALGVFGGLLLTAGLARKLGTA